MSLIKNSRIKIATIYILLAYLCIFMVQANDTSNSNNHKNNINNEHHHSHHNHHHHHHHSQQQHNQHLRSRSHYSNSIRNNNKNNKNSNLNTTNTNINLDRRKILNITPTTTTNISPSAAIDNKFISNRSLKQNYSKISNNDNNHKLNLHKRNSIDNNNRTVNGNSANENLEIFTNYNGLRRKSLINTDYNNYHSISNHNNDNKNNVLHDVEMINEHHNNKWNYNNDDKVFDISTSEPLPSVTMPTPTTTTTTTTMSLIPSKGKTFHKMKDDGRHICVQHKTVQIPVKTREIYSRPTWKHVTEPCEENQICTRVQLVHEPVYRDIVRHKSTRQVTYECCPGWEPTTKNANSCMKPVCKVKCKNGGTCITPDTCSCPKGFTGKYCEEDINECITEKPCDQLCFNTNGSYYCECKKGFILMNDKQSCKKINGFNNDDDAFEARDLENDIDTDTTVLNTRIQKLEKMIANDRITTNELYKNFQTATHLIDSLKTRLTTLEKQQHDISHLQDKLMTNDVKTKTLEYLVNILLKCQKNPHNCQHI